MLESTISWNYTTWLNIAFLAVAAVLVFWFYRSGSGPMLRMMGGSPDSKHDHSHHDHDHDHADAGTHHQHVPGGHDHAGHDHAGHDRLEHSHAEHAHLHREPEVGGHQGVDGRP